MMKCTPEVRIATAPVASANSAAAAMAAGATTSALGHPGCVQHHHGIGTDAQHGGMAEADQPRAADQQRERQTAAMARIMARASRVMVHPCAEAEPGRGGQQAEQQQRRAGRPERRAHRRQPAARAGNRPRGRMARISAMAM